MKMARRKRTFGGDGEGDDDNKNDNSENDDPLADFNARAERRRLRQQRRKEQRRREANNRRRAHALLRRVKALEDERWIDNDERQKESLRFFEEKERLESQIKELTRELKNANATIQKLTNSAARGGGSPSPQHHQNPIDDDNVEGSNKKEEVAEESFNLIRNQLYGANSGKRWDDDETVAGSSEGKGEDAALRSGGGRSRVPFAATATAAAAAEEGAKDEESEEDGSASLRRPSRGRLHAHLDNAAKGAEGTATAENSFDLEKNADATNTDEVQPRRMKQRAPPRHASSSAAAAVDHNEAEGDGNGYGRPTFAPTVSRGRQPPSSSAAGDDSAPAAPSRRKNARGGPPMHYGPF